MADETVLLRNCERSALEAMIFGMCEMFQRDYLDAHRAVGSNGEALKLQAADVTNVVQQW